MEAPIEAQPLMMATVVPGDGVGKQQNPVVQPPLVPQQQPLVPVFGQLVAVPTAVATGPHSGRTSRWAFRASLCTGVVGAVCLLFTLMRTVRATTTGAQCLNVCDDASSSCTGSVCTSTTACAYHCFPAGWCTAGDVVEYQNGAEQAVACPDGMVDQGPVRVAAVMTMLLTAVCVATMASFPLCCSCDCFGADHVTRPCRGSTACRVILSVCGWVTLGCFLFSTGVTISILEQDPTGPGNSHSDSSFSAASLVTIGILSPLSAWFMLLARYTASRREQQQVNPTATTGAGGADDATTRCSKEADLSRPGCVSVSVAIWIVAILVVVLGLTSIEGNDVWGSNNIYHGGYIPEPYGDWGNPPDGRCFATANITSWSCTCSGGTNWNSNGDGYLKTFTQTAPNKEAGIDANALSQMYQWQPSNVGAALSSRWPWVTSLSNTTAVCDPIAAAAAGFPFNCTDVALGVQLGGGSWAAEQIKYEIIALAGVWGQCAPTSGSCTQVGTAVDVCIAEEQVAVAGRPFLSARGTCSQGGGGGGSMRPMVAMAAMAATVVSGEASSDWISVDL